MQAAARAYTNIALIKYWGKKDEQLILPMNSSLSLTLNAFYTETRVTLQQSLSCDEIIMDGKVLSGHSAEKIIRFMNQVRDQSGNRTYALIVTNNHVPVASGFASSASGFAALAASAARAYGLDCSGVALSRLARRGSGSASRSIYGGFVKWMKGTKDEDSYAVPIDPANWGIRLVVVAVNRQKKKISSRLGMKRTVQTSPFYPIWMKEAEKDLGRMEQAIHHHDLEMIGEIAEANALKMHATMLAATPPFTYWEEGTLTVMRRAAHLREQGIPCYFTIDAGPNVKLICSVEHVDQILDDLSDFFPLEALITAEPGPGVQFLEDPIH
ncbi:diphosphomevalonate decarboxylase [Terrilactibacillus sp. BCM23-1]|uniref:diphosphomevalonate decarboxylase n=1 Tax=Terrilactibacillus tamarindi TaxID=2599694 RepID=A0A6N8CQE1_9BACI|nr:diphosphomevalonate decarboxylase [Terrilactibacillus tamarindi]MTT31387.1 diphosphomevalonate decarboxylase [Terrilactibacillus tamarindi]